MVSELSSDSLDCSKSSQNLSRLAISLLAPLVHEVSADGDLTIIMTAASSSSSSGEGLCRARSSARLLSSIPNTRSWF